MGAELRLQHNLCGDHVDNYHNTTIMPQKLASWAQELQSLRRSRGSLSRDSMNDNHAAKISILGPEAPIFAEITWIISSITRHITAKIGVLGPSGSNLCRDHVDYNRAKGVLGPGHNNHQQLHQY